MLFLAVLSLLCAVPGRAQLEPQAALAALEAADGLEVSLFAAEPDLVNPTCMDVDAQGRVWVAEAANYRLFNQPETRSAGDRIQVLEDTDGDGRCDKATTFYQDPSLQAPMGIAVLGDRVYVCQSPDLFYLRDTNGDGVADEKTVVLSGFKGVDHDHALHGVVFGPDGRLYMTVGDRGLEVTDKSGNQVLAGPDTPHLGASVLRSDLEGNRLELLAWNFRNDYEPAVDSFGNVFVSDNDDDGNAQVRICHVMEGGNYGYLPRVKGDRRRDEVHWNMDRPGVVPKMLGTGAGSPCGLLVYEGNLLPGLYQGALLHAEAGPRVIRAYPYAAQGAGFEARIAIVLDGKADTWFRPSDVCVAPDGSLFLADWYDPGVGGHRMGDTTRGRIFRVAPQGAKYAVPVHDLAGADRRVIAALASPNHALRYRAHVAFAAMAEEGEVARLRGLFDEARGQGPVLEARMAWILAATEQHRGWILEEVARAADPRLRTLAVRLMAEHAPDQIAAHALHRDPSPAVRRQVLLEIARCTALQREREALLPDLIAGYDGHDRFYREAIGIATRGVEAQAWQAYLARHGDVWDAPLAGLAVQWHLPEMLDLAAAALRNSAIEDALRIEAVNLLDALRTPEAGALLVETVTADYPAAVMARALDLLARDEGDIWRKVTGSVSFAEGLRAALRDPARHEGVWRFIADTKNTHFLPEMAAAALSTETPRERRLQTLEAVRALGPKLPSKQAEAQAGALKALLESEDLEIAVAALRAIGAFSRARGEDFLREVLVDAARPAALHIEAVRLLHGSRSGAISVMKLAEEGRLPEDVKIEARELAHASPHEEVRMMAEQLMPRELTLEGRPLPPLAELAAMPGDAARGHAVFFSPEKAECSRCHRVGEEGREVGPNLTQIGAKYGREGLLESILNPSAAISHEYQVHIVETGSEGFVSGFIRSENADGFELMDAAGNTLRVLRADVESMRKSAVSLMPTGLTAALTTQDLVDLVAYLEQCR
jgi:putative membrane-bound dehydrogenase-like protein